MKKHAYCILAHHEPELFRRLIELLDDPSNDIFVHIDKRTDLSPFLEVQCKSSRLVFLSKRLACNWGAPNIVRAELDLFKAANMEGPYACYHLVSGVDLPVQSQEAIHKYVTDHPGANYIGICRTPEGGKSLRQRTRYYYPVIGRPGGGFTNQIKRRIERSMTFIQKGLHISRSYPFPLWKGAQWISISEEFCSYLIQKEKDIVSVFKGTLCADEIAIHSVFMNSPFADTQHMPEGDEYDQCMREIDWQRGSPYTWGAKDYDILTNSRHWFARKFSSQDLAFIDRVCTFVKNNV